MAAIGLIGYSTYLLIGGISFPGAGDHFTPSAIIYDLEVSAGAGGEVNVVKGKYEKNQEVNLEATAQDGYSFVGWYDEDGNYITSTKNYKFNITHKTNLFARFNKTPEPTVGEGEYAEILRDCEVDFEIIVKCEKENAQQWLMENFVIIDNDLIGTEYENVAFEVLQYEEGTFIIKSVEDYENGVTYTATFEGIVGEEEATILTGGGTGRQSLDFTIKKDLKTEIEQKAGVVFINLSDTTLVKGHFDDGLIEGEENDQEDYVVLANADNIEEGTVFCMFTEVDGEGNPVIGFDSLYGKCKSKEAVSAGIKVVYTFPEMSEIFEILEIFTKEDFDFEGAGVEISDDVLGDAGYAFITSKSFQDYVANATFAASKALEGTGCSVKPFSTPEDITENIEVIATSEVVGSIVKVKIDATLNLPLIDSLDKEVGVFKLDLNYNKDISLSAYFSYTLRNKKGLQDGFKSYDVGQIVSYEDSCELNVAVLYSADYNNAQQLNEDIIRDACMKALHSANNKIEKDKIAELFAQAGYACTAAKEVDLFTVRNVIANIVDVTADVDLVLEFDVAGSLFYKSQSTNYACVGVRSQGNGKGKMYKELSATDSCADVIVSGDVLVRSGLKVQSDIKFIGMAKYIAASICVDTGVSIQADGYISKQSGHIAGGYSVDAYNAGSAVTKMFGDVERFDRSVSTINLVDVGYKNVLLYWANEDVEEDYVLGIIDEKTDLLKLESLSVIVYKHNGKVKEEKLSANSKDYTVQVITEGKYLTYSNGKLEVAKNAPAYFTEQITIKVLAANNWIEASDSAYASYLKDITITVEYGNADSYYDAIDSDIEKEFRRLYRTYNEANVEVIDEMLTKLISDFITADVGDGKVFLIVVDEYIGSIFSVIKDYRAQEDGKRTMENKFVKEEARSFISIIELFNSVAGEHEVNEEDIRQLIESIENSEVLTRMLINMSEREDFSEYLGSISVNEQDKPTIESAFDWHREHTTNPERAERLIDVLKHLFKM